MPVLNQPNQNGGVNVRTHPSLIRDSQVSLGYNMDFSVLGEVSQKLGYEKVLNEISAVNASIGLGRYIKLSTGVEYIIIKVNGQFRYATPGSSTWSILESGYSTTFSDFGDHTTWKDNVYVMNEVDPVLRWNGTGVFTQLTLLPRGKYGCVSNNNGDNRLFIAGITANKSRLAWTDLGAETFTSSNFVDIAADDGNEITGLKISEGKLRVYKGKGGSFTINYTDTGVPFPVRDDTYEGCARHQTVANFEKPSIYLATETVRLMGQQPQYPTSQRDDDISEVIRPIIKLMNQATFKNTAGAAYFNKEYFLAIPTGASTFNNILLNYTVSQKTDDYPYGAWSVWTNTYANALVVWNGYLHFCDSRKGQLYRFNQDVKADDGTVIESVLQTKFTSLGKPNIKKRIKAVNVRAFIDAGGTLQLAYSRDFGSFSNPLTATPNASGGSPGDPTGLISNVAVAAGTLGSASLELGTSGAVFGSSGLDTSVPIFVSFKWDLGQLECTYIALRFTNNTANKSWKLIDFDYEYDELPEHDWEPFNCALGYPS